MDSTLDAHAKPPVHLRSVYKRYQKLSSKQLASEPQVFDAKSGITAGFVPSHAAREDLQLPDELQVVIDSFLGIERQGTANDASCVAERGEAYEHPEAPGMCLVRPRSRRFLSEKR